MPRPALPHLDVSPLVGFAAHRHISHATWAERAGTTVCALRRQITRRGGIGWESADVLANALDLHPAEVWGGEWWAVCAAYEEHEHDTDAAWREVERSHAQWIAQRERFALLHAEAV